MRPLFAIAPLALALALLGPSAQAPMNDPTLVQAFLDWITPDLTSAPTSASPVTADSSTALGLRSR